MNSYDKEEGFLNVTGDAFNDNNKIILHKRPDFW